MVQWYEIKYKHYQKESTKNYLEYVKNNDKYYYFLKHYQKENIKYSMYGAEIFDVLDNEGMNNLMRKIQNIVDDKIHYVTDCFLRSSRMHDLKYLHMMEDGITTGRVAEIKLYEDPYISEIDIEFTYLNNSEILIHYTFFFRKAINSFVRQSQFIQENIANIKMYPYVHTFADKHFWNNPKYEEVADLESAYIGDVLQGIMCKMFYTLFGKRNKLPMVYNYNMHRYNKKVARKLRNTYFNVCYDFSDRKEFWIIEDWKNDRFEIENYQIGRQINRGSVYKLLLDNGMEAYFLIFGNIERHEIERRLGKYFNSKKRWISFDDQTWLMNKFRYIEDSRRLQERRIKRDGNTNVCKAYIQGKLTDEKLIDYPKQCDEFMNKYQRYINYFSSLGAVQYNRIVLEITGVTLVATIITLVATFLLNQG